MKYKSKHTYIIEFTEAQILWLETLLVRGMDGAFQGNPRERKHCDNIIDKLQEELELEL